MTRILRRLFRSLFGASADARGTDVASPITSIRSTELTGHIDCPTNGATVPAGPLIVRGWHKWGNEPAIAVAVTLNGSLAGRGVIGCEARPDVAEAYAIPELVGTGWNVPISLDGLPEGDAHVSVSIWGAPDQPPILLEPVNIRVEGSVEHAEGDTGTLAPTEYPNRFFGLIDIPQAGEILPYDFVRIVGWALTEEAPVDGVDVVVNGINMGPARLGLERADVERHHRVPHALVSGFEHLIDLRHVPHVDDLVTIEIVARTVFAGPTTVASGSFMVSPAAIPERNGDREALIRQRSDRLLNAGSMFPADPELRLVVFTHDMGYGGGQLWLSELLIRAGAGTDFPCGIVAPKTGPLVGDLEKLGIEVHITQDYPLRHLEVYEARIQELGYWVQQRGYNAALANTFGSFFGADLATRIGIPLVWAIHESWPPAAFWSVAFPQGSVDAAIRLAAEGALGRAHAVVFEAEATRRQYEEAIGEGRSLVVPYGVDVDAIERYRMMCSRSAARVACRLPKDALVLLVMGTTEPRKAQTLLAEAFAAMSSYRDDAFLVFVGDTGSPYAAALKEFLRQAGMSNRTMVVPVVEDTYQWYRAADVLVSASDVESLPRSVLEAMGFGLPILATSVFGMPELITDGENGFLYDPCDLAAARNALLRVFEASDEQLANMGSAGRQLVLARHDSRGYAGDIIHLLEGFRRNPHALPADLLSHRIRLP